ncbi:cytochrome P450 [Aeoliella sp. ICT_H6.2]|uniref:Cytochrome P450 n=1 Tax=Aeoliella straminimaris TaxID=2954799 RepID=A0A9X2F9R0_9BACT|nr:cytochrome P450 [Aeoliella straminimaris]MCO6044990.1 cytochrome P450 [Aeoliella straminimaris]
MLSPDQHADGLPAVSHLPLAEFADDVLGNLFALHEEFGPVAAIEDGGQRLVVLFDPELNFQVLRDTDTYQGRFFPIRGPKRSSQRRLTCGLLGMNGEQHARNRRILKDAFSLRAIAGYRPAVESITDRWLDAWQPGSTIDLNDEMTRYMLTVTSTLLFGMNDQQQACELGEQIADWVSRMHDIGAGALVPDAAFDAGYEPLLEQAEELERSVTAMIARRRETIADQPDACDVLSLLVRGHGELGKLSDEELVGQACVLFGAAHMTTAHSLTWTLLLLSLHPEIAANLLAETLGPEEARTGLIDRVIKESMRVLPASSYSQRVTSRRVQVGPYDCLPGTPIVFTPLITHRLPGLYEDPRTFNPDRWLDIKPSTYEYLPFGAGARMCIGGPLAMEILRHAIPRILERFRLDVPAGTEINAQVTGTMLSPVATVPIELHEADGQFSSHPIQGNLTTLLNLPGAAEASTRPRQPR